MRLSGYAPARTWSRALKQCICTFACLGWACQPTHCPFTLCRTETSQKSPMQVHAVSTVNAQLESQNSRLLSQTQIAECNQSHLSCVSEVDRVARTAQINRPSRRPTQARAQDEKVCLECALYRPASAQRYSDTCTAVRRNESGHAQRPCIKQKAQGKRPILYRTLSSTIAECPQLML